MRVLFLTAVALGALMAPCYGQEVPAIKPDDGATVSATAVRHHRKSTPAAPKDNAIKVTEVPAGPGLAPQESDGTVATLASVPAGPAQGSNGSRYPHRPPPRANPINQANLGAEGMIRRKHCSLRLPQKRPSSFRQSPRSSLPKKARPKTRLQQIAVRLNLSQPQPRRALWVSLSIHTKRSGGRMNKRNGISRRLGYTP